MGVGGDFLGIFGSRFHYEGAEECFAHYLLVGGGNGDQSTR